MASFHSTQNHGDMKVPYGQLIDSEKKKNPSLTSRWLRYYVPTSQKQGGGGHETPCSWEGVKNREKPPREQNFKQFSVVSIT